MFGVAANIKSRVFRLGSEAIWVLFGQVGVAVGGLINVKILTHLLSPNEFGRLSIANTVIVLVGMIVFGPLGQGLMRFWSISEERNEIITYHTVSKRYINLLVNFFIVVSLLSGVGLSISDLDEWSWVIAFALIAGTFSGWAGIRLSILMASRNRKNVALINSLTAFAKPAIAAVLVLMFGFTADFALLGFLIASGVSVYFADFYYKKIVYGKVGYLKTNRVSDSGNRLAKEIISFSYPFLIWGIFAWAHQSCDRWAILSYNGTDAVGAYSVISQLAFYPLIFGANFLSTFFIPIAYKRAGELQSTEAVHSGNKILISMTCLYIAGAAALYVFFSFYHRELVLLISNEKYVVYSELLPSLTGAWCLYYLGQILSGFGLMVNKPGVYLLPIVSSGVLATATTFFLGAKFGVQGVIWALGLSGLFYSSWCMIVVKKIISVNKRY